LLLTMSLQYVALALSLLISVSLARSYSVGEISDEAVTRPMPKNAIWVPQYKQKTDYSCGPSSALSVLRYWLPEKFGNYTGTQSSSLCIDFYFTFVPHVFKLISLFFVL
jgi:hypothetical protein